MVITRIPPSPTGHLHIGTVRTALFNYLYAKHNDGKMLFRSEDTDQARSTKEFEDEIIKGLQALGITWDNEELVRQSERKDVYRKYLEEGIEKGSFYISKEESKQKPGETVEVVRLKNPNKTITFSDLVRGDITFDTSELGDIVIARSIDDALYHFTVVVDDNEMGITHVLRGEDHISNTPRQILIQEALGMERPQYAHLPLILAPDRSKMSKRHGAVAVEEYLNDGFLPEAIVNYLALLGWNPGTDEEVFTMDQLVEKFSLDGIQKAGAVFDQQKFRWLNKEHLNKLSDTEYIKALDNYWPESVTSLPEFSPERIEKLLPVIRERAETFGDIRDAAEAGEYNYAFGPIDVSVEMIKWKKDDSVVAAKPRLEKVLELLQGADFSSIDSIKAAIWDYAESEGKGEVLWPFRVALTNLERSPDPFSVAFVLGKEEVLQRVEAACDKIRE